MSLIPNRTTKPTRKSPQEIMNNSEDQDFNISCVEIAGYDLQNDRIVRILADANGTLKTSSNQYAVAVYYNGDKTTEYICKALPGTSLITTSWQVMKNTYDSDGDLIRTQWCDGNDNFDNIATDYVTVNALTYS